MSGTIPNEWSGNDHEHIDTPMVGAGMAAAGDADTSEEQSRRAFLAKCGKFAIVTPPTVTLLLHTSMASATGYGSPHGDKKGRRRRRRRRRKWHKHYPGCGCPGF